MSPGELKPILTALVLPPASLLLLALAGTVLALRRRVRTGVAVVLLGTALLWLASCQAIAVLLFGLLPPVEPLKPGQIERVQAIVVLGGGVLEHAPEYGAQQPSGSTLGRLRYAAHLAKASGKPVAFAGGVGWASVNTAIDPEAVVAARALQPFGIELRWADSKSRDTEENAREMRKVLPADVRRIALVTDAWHMPRSVLAFRRQGFEVTPAPTGFPSPQTRALLAWLPSSDGLTLSRQVVREALGLLVARF